MELQNSSRRVSAALLALLVPACGVFGADEAPEAPATVAPGEPPLPPGAPNAVTGTPTADELTEQFGVFVTPDGSDDAPGTRAAPRRTIAAGVAAAKAAAKRVYVCQGSYAESLELVSAVSVIGGYECPVGKAWSKPAGVRSVLASPSSPAVRAVDITNTTRFEAFDVIAPDAVDAGTSSRGLVAQRAGKLTLADVRVRAGRGADGASGVAPAAPADGPGARGGAAVLGKYNYVRPANDFFPVLAVVSGGTSACGGDAGGAGGVGGVWQRVKVGLSTRAVLATRFVGGVDIKINRDVPAASLVPGVGSAGIDGRSAVRPGSMQGVEFLPTDGEPGGNGTGGRGGSGGRAQLPEDLGVEDVYDTLANGAGGGAGGCGGRAATAGQGGGASIAAIVVDSAGLTLDGVSLEAAAGGAGGAGSFGSEASPGGGAGEWGVSTGMAVAGSPGGRAGVSGHGAGGSSFGLAYSGMKPAMTSGTVAKAGAAGGGVAAQDITSDINGQSATIPASVAGEAKDVAAF